jgi:hypothetical protein
VAGLTLRGWERTIRVEGPDEVLDQVRRLLPDGYRPSDREPERTWTVTARKGTWRLKAGGSEIAEGPRTYLLASAVADIEAWMAVAAKRRVFVDAACVVADGRAILLPGTSSSGRSALAAALVARGATYFSDRFALLDPAGQVHPYARPMSVRHGNADAPDADPARVSAPVALVAALSDEGAWSVTEGTAADAAASLVAHSPAAGARARAVATAVEHATAGARFVTGSRGDGGEAASHLLALALPG